MSDSDQNEKNTAEYSSIVDEFQKRHSQALGKLSYWRQNAIQDFNMFNANSNSDNQWNQTTMSQSTGLGQVKRTFNIIAAHSRQIENNCFMQKFEPRIEAVGLNASNEAASVLTGVIRHIINKNNAQDNAFKTAIEHQVRVGLGWNHIECEYEDDRSFNQSFKISSVPTPLMVTFDTQTKEADMSDMQWACLTSFMPRDEFDSMYPNFKYIKSDSNPFNSTEAVTPVVQDEFYNGLEDKGSIKIATYYKRIITEETLVAYTDKNDNLVTKFESELTKAEKKAIASIIKRGGKIPKRPTKRERIHKYIIADKTIIDESETPFNLIPLVPWVGNFYYANNRQPDWYGIVRCLIDVQLTLNSTASAFENQQNMSSRAHWLADYESINGELNQVWQGSNVQDTLVLPYSSLSSGPNPRELQPPQLVQPKPISPVAQYMQETAMNLAMKITGQHEAQMGENGNEVSGLAIFARQRQSETATFQYTNNQNAAMCYMARLFIHAIPLVYDVERDIQIQGESGPSSSGMISPNINTAYQRFTGTPGQDMQPVPEGVSDDDLDPKTLVKVINPNIGKYSVTAGVGKSFETRRQEFVTTIMALAQSFPAIVQQTSDVIVKNMDFPGADEISKRLTPNNPEVQQLQQQVQQLTQQNQQLTLLNNDKTFTHNIEQARFQNEVNRDNRRFQIDEQRLVIDQNKVDVTKDKVNVDLISSIGETDASAVSSIVPVVSENIKMAQIEQGQNIAIQNGFMRAQQQPQEPVHYHEMWSMEPDQIPNIPPSQPPLPQQPTQQQENFHNHEMAEPERMNIERIPSTNQPGGPIRDDNPSVGDVT